MEKILLAFLLMFPGILSPEVSTQIAPLQTNIGLSKIIGPL